MVRENISGKVFEKEKGYANKKLNKKEQHNAKK